MTLDELQAKISDMANGFEDFIDNEAPIIVGKMAQDFYKESFQEEGFTDASFEPWQEVKRRINPRRPDRAAASRKILTGETGDLGRSIMLDTGTAKATITAEVFSKTGFNYAPVHNSGTDKIPARPFVKESEVLNEKIVEEMDKRISRMINK